MTHLDVLGIPGTPSIGCGMLPGAAKSVCKTVTNPIGSAAEWATEHAMDGLTASIAHGATWALGEVLDFMRNVTTAPVGADWFVSSYERVFTQSAILALVMLLLAAIMSAFKGIHVLVHAVKMVPAWGFLSGIGIAAMVGLRDIVTTMEQGMAISSAGQSTQSLLHGMADSLAASVTGGAGGLGIAPMATAILALIILTGAFICFVTWWVLQVGLTLLTFFLPFANSLLILPSTGQLTKVYYEVLAAVQFSPLLVLGGVSLGLDAVANMTGANGGGVSALLAGGGTLLLAGLMPFMLIKVIPLVSHASGSMLTHSDMKQAPGVKQASDATGDMVRGKLRGGGGGGASAAGGGGAAAGAGAAAAGIGAAASIPAAVGASTASQTVPVMDTSARQSSPSYGEPLRPPTGTTGGSQ